MKMKNKLILLFSILLVLSCFSLTTFATEDETTILEQRKEEILNSTTTYKIEYTYDSTLQTGISYEIITDPFTYLTTLSIVKDLPFGYTIYDKTDTEIIDGVRINGQTITGLRNIPISTNEESYVITVKIVYAEGIPGLIAKISDGTVTAEELLSNPLILMQLAYYVIAALSIILGGFGVLRSKKKKVKTADDMAALIESKTTEAYQNLQTQFLQLLDESLLPLVQKTVDTNKQIVKAVTLSTSKMKDAPIALLDTLKEIGDINTAEMLESAKASVIKNMKAKETSKTKIVEALQNIVAKEEKEEKDDEVEEKSVF